MAIDEAEVRRIAELARLEPDAAAIANYARQLQSIVDYVAVLDELEPPPDAERAPAEPTALRPDRPHAPLGADRAVANAPDAAAGQFRVPGVLPG